MKRLFLASALIHPNLFGLQRDAISNNIKLNLKFSLISFHP